ADAILYVTYYNHALSRADKDFLLQLGRVKDAFQLDKMFFIINAADLAESDDDLQLVMQYVEEQLLQLGVRYPKIYPVSSKQSLKEKLKKQALNTLIQKFENDFHLFIHNDLAYLTMESALVDIHRAYQTLANNIKSVNLNEQEKQNYRYVLLQNKENLKHSIDSTDSTLYDERIKQKTEKQLHYVEERLSIRFHDMFKEMFNPTTITESGKKAEAQLQRSLINLLDYTGYELLQELRAVSLRIEAYLFELQHEVYQDINNKVKQIDNSFILPGLQMNDLETPDYEQAFTEINVTPFNNDLSRFKGIKTFFANNKIKKIVNSFILPGLQMNDLEKPYYEQAFIEINVTPFNKALSRFKGTKAFFAKNEKELMKEDLFVIISPFISDYISDNGKQMKLSYINQWTQILQTMKQQMKETVDDYVENNLSVMSDTVGLDDLEDKQQKLSLILDMYDV